MKKIIMAVLCCAMVLTAFSGCAGQPAKEKQEAAAEPAAAEEEKETAEAVVEEKEEQTAEEETSGEAGEVLEAEEVVVKEGILERAEINSAAIGENKLEEKTEQKLHIYLPPTYQESEKAYPVVYFLHGFGDSPTVFVRNAKKVLDPEFSKDPSKEFILVAVSGSNSAGGSYYVNSPITGNWEDYTVNEVVSYIDTNYRTIAKADARGICGFSMGGFAALNLAFRHPDVYSAVYAMSPGVLAPGEIGTALASWEGDQVFLKAYSMAFAYDENPPYVAIPSGDGSDADKLLLERWESGFGNWQEKLDDYLALQTPLKAIGFCYGTNDGYVWIPEGTEYLSGLLDKEGIACTMYSFTGGHILPPDFMKDQLLPFFDEFLSYE
ncbi:MAG: alpha/beta hydrolase-fold protein [Lachnospiraceae bacterium]